MFGFFGGGSGGGGGAPSGAAGGDLGSTYPNPTVVAVGNVTTGALPVANGGTGATTTTGTVANVLSTSPTLVTPLASTISSVAGADFLAQATAPVQSTGALVGNAATFRASDAVAGSSTAGAQLGGAVVIQAGDAKRLTSGTAAGGLINFSSGVGIGGGNNGIIKFSPGGTNRWQFDTGGNFVATTDNQVDIGASAATRPRDFFLARNAVVGGNISIAAGTTAVAPLTYTAGTNKTTSAAGDVEFDGTSFFTTTNTTNSRTVDDAWNFFRLTGSGTGITTIADFFGATGSGIPMVSGGVYEIEWHCYFSQATAGTATWTITTATTALANLTAEYVGSPIAGIGTSGTPQTAGVNVTSSSATAMPVTGTEATGATHQFVIHAIATAGAGASNTRLRLTMSAGTATPLINSYFKVRQLPSANVGAFIT